MTTRHSLRSLSVTGARLAIEHDDAPRGRVLTRREALALLGAAPLVFAPLRAAAAACVATPAQTEGPFFVDTRLERVDVRSDPGGAPVRAGTPLALELTVSRLNAAGCAPLAGAVVDIWHCDADGAYSGTRGSERFLRVSPCMPSATSHALALRCARARCSPRSMARA